VVVELLQAGVEREDEVGESSEVVGVDAVVECPAEFFERFAFEVAEHGGA
jgi:hypothetical protein